MTDINDENLFVDEHYIHSLDNIKIFIGQNYERVLL